MIAKVVGQNILALGLVGKKIIKLIKRY